MAHENEEPIIIPFEGADKDITDILPLKVYALVFGILGGFLIYY